jgi:2-methylcitrate dehydratase PrpD
MLKYSPVSSMGVNGVMAAQLAHKGFVGEQNIFNAPEEFWRAFGTVGLNQERLLTGLGQTWQVSRTSFKPYSACRYGHPAIALFTKLIQRHESSPRTWIASSYVPSSAAWTSSDPPTRLRHRRIRNSVSRWRWAPPPTDPI